MATDKKDIKAKKGFFTRLATGSVKAVGKLAKLTGKGLLVLGGVNIVYNVADTLVQRFSDKSIDAHVINDEKSVGLHLSLDTDVVSTTQDLSSQVNAQDAANAATVNRDVDIIDTTQTGSTEVAMEGP